MNTPNQAGQLNRRNFIKGSAGLTALAASGSLADLKAATAAEPPGKAKTIGIQVGAVSFVDEGTHQVLDILQQRGSIDTIQYAKKSHEKSHEHEPV